MKLMDRQVILPGVVQNTWLHTDGAGNDNITIESKQDSAPIIESVKRAAGSGSKDMALVAKIPSVLVEETARACARHWGIKVKDAFAELVADKTDRSHAVWKILVEGRDYRKLQTKAY